MDDWEKSDVFQSLNKLLQKDFCSLFRNEGIIFSSEFQDEDLVLVYSLPFDRNFVIQTRLSLLLGPFQIIFSLRRDNSITDSLIADVKVSYELTFRLSTYSGKVLKENLSSLIYDPESREIQMSESIFQILKKMNCFLADSDDGNFHFCSGISSNKNLKVDQIFVEFSNSYQGSDVITRSRICTYLIESEILFSDEFFESISTEKCRACSELENKVKGLDLLKQLPPGIAIASGQNREKTATKKEPTKAGVVVIKNGETAMPLPRVKKAAPAAAKPAPVRPFATRKRTIEDIPVMAESDLNLSDLDDFQVKYLQKLVYSAFPIGILTSLK